MAVALGSSLVALGVTVAGIGLFNLTNGSDGPGDPTVAAAGLPSTSAAISSSPRGTAPAVSTGLPRRISTPASKPVSTPAGRRASAPPATAAARPALVVLNASRVQGLAARAATRLRSAGYPVRHTGNLRARVATSTVYYDPAQAAQAKALVGAGLGIARAEPRPQWVLGTGTLIVVVTRDYVAG